VDGVLLAVNGTLMRGLHLNDHLLDAGGVFVRTAVTAPVYRLWSIGDRHPAMIRTTAGDGTAVALEVWRVPLDGLARVVIGEPGGLCLGKVLLDDGDEVLGVLAEPYLVEGHVEITSFGGWRPYIAGDDNAEGNRR
jgi:hypothetical protein